MLLAHAVPRSEHPASVPAVCGVKRAAGAQGQGKCRVGPQAEVPAGSRRAQRLTQAPRVISPAGPRASPRVWATETQGRGGVGWTPGVSFVPGSPLPVSKTHLPSLERRCGLRPQRVPSVPGVNYTYAALSRPRPLPAQDSLLELAAEPAGWPPRPTDTALGVTSARTRQTGRRSASAPPSSSPCRC